MDYLARDQKRTFAGSAEIQQEKLIEDARVCLVDCGHSGSRHMEICYPEKLVDQVTAFFNNRFHMFSTVYNHKNTVSGKFSSKNPSVHFNSIPTNKLCRL